MPELKPTLKIPSCVQNVQEVLVPREIKFTGTIPSWLRGNIFATGPGTFDLEKGSVKSFLDGFTIVTKVEIEGKTNSVKISSKHVQTIAYKKAMKAKQPILIGFGHPPGPDDEKGFFAKLLPFGPNDITDNASVASVLTLIDSNYYLLSEGHTFYQINPRTLDTIGSVTTQKAFDLNGISPDLVLQDGDSYIAGSAMKPTFQHVIMKMPLSSKGKKMEEKFRIVGSIPSRWKFGPCCIRNCFRVTDNYIVFIECPIVINLMKIAGTYIKGYNMTDWIDWIPNDKTRFYLMHKSTGKVVKVEYLSEKAVLVVGIINVYENHNQVVLDLCTQRNIALFEAVSLSNMRSLIAPKSYMPGALDRFIIPIIPDNSVRKFPENAALLNPAEKAKATKKGDKIILTPERISENFLFGCDMGVVNPKYSSKKHSYIYVANNVYSCNSNSKTFTPGGIAKVYLNEGNRQLVWEGEVGQVPWYCLFIPNPSSDAREDDGILVTIVTNLLRKQSDFLLVVDATNMTEIARAELKDCHASVWMNAQFFPSD